MSLKWSEVLYSQMSQSSQTTVTKRITQSHLYIVLECIQFINKIKSREVNGHKNAVLCANIVSIGDELLGSALFHLIAHGHNICTPGTIV